MFATLGTVRSFVSDLVLPDGVVPSALLPDFLDQIHVLDYQAEIVEDRRVTTFWVAVEGHPSISLAGVDGGTLSLGDPSLPYTQLVATIETGNEFSITVRGMRLTLRFGSDAVGGSGKSSELVFEGTIRLDSNLAITATDVVLTGDLEGVIAPGESIQIGGFHLSRESFALRWTEPDINRWLRKISSDLADETPAIASDLTLRVVFGNPIQEIRLDWTINGASRTFKLPGFKIATPDNAQLTLMFGGAGRSLTEVALGLTFAQNTSLTASSTFAWGRGEERESQSDPAPSNPLIELKLTARQPVSLAVVDFDFTKLALPKFLKQIGPPLAPLDFDNPGSLDAPTPFGLGSLDPALWGFDFKLNLDPPNLPFKLPFLQAPVGGEAQHIQIDQFDPSKLVPDLLNHTFKLPVGVTVFIGPMQLHTELDLEFNWETFAFKVDHDAGLQLFSKEDKIEPSEDFLGLHWRFRGKKPAVNGRYHYFTLATKDNNYQLQQAPGSTFEVEYGELSSDGVLFTLSDFVLSGKGVSLTAAVADRPARLNGIDTRFRFTDTKLVIKENRITDFTLTGSGPLPPALVGDASVDIALQMAQRDGKLTLVSGGAKLKAKILDCKGTRFRFSIDAIGLKFVYEKKFHLYFTLTGSAQFTPLPGDDSNGALALLGKIKIDLVDCPLTGDASVIAKHIQFLVELPRPLSFNFLGAFEMELRGIGFVPQAEVFGGDGAMIVTGQLKFAQGAGDAPDSRVDLHKLYIGLPKKGSIIPRIHFENLPVHLNFGSAFQLNGTVDFVDGTLEKGFSGEGVLTIQGLPTFAAAFAFLRVRRDETSPWVRAWFVYAEARKISFMIPVVEMYIREVGLGFGYRYTLASIRAADQANDVRQLLTELTKLSRTQGDLAKRDRWSVDLEPTGEDPRWTVALRAMISQTSGQTSPLQWNEKSEKDLSCLFLLDAVIALRSDLTFLMTARGWLFANYYDFVTDYKGIRNKPVFSGFVLLSPRHKRLLAHVASNPDGQLGPHPTLPGFVQKALSKSQFSATLLVEPGLLHTELGWPNQLRWSDKYGPLTAEFQGGLLFRVSRDELVTGVSFLARGRLEISAGLSLGVVGVRVSASAALAFGARYIGLLSLRDPLGSSAMYGGIGIEAMIRFAIEFWIRIKIWRIKITKTWRFSLSLQFTAGLEFGFVGISTSGVGLRGTGHLAVAVMGRRFAVSANLGINEGAVRTALERTQHVLKYGLEATEVESIPGLPGTGTASATSAPARLATLATSATPLEATETLAVSTTDSAMAAGATTFTYHAPGYTLFVIRGASPTDPSHFVLFPAGERAGGTGPNGETVYVEEPGFLPVPPPDGVTPASDFLLQVPKGASESWSLDQWDPVSATWSSRITSAQTGSTSVSWGAHWEAPIVQGDQHAIGSDGEPTGEVESQDYTLRQYLRSAFVLDDSDLPQGDPDVLPGGDTVEDPRVHNPTDDAFESAVRGAMEQFRGAPFFRRDPNSEYEQLLQFAYSDETTIYHPSGQVPADDAGLADMQRQQQAHELRGLVVHDMIADLRDYAAAANKSDAALTQGKVAFEMGLVFRLQGTPAWLDDLAVSGPTLAQRLGTDASAPVAADAQPVRTFNVKSTEFSANPPRFDRVQQLTDARTIALAWDLVWPQAPSALATEAQKDPEHHLLNYLVRRRALDGNDREVVFTLKGADTLHREAGAPGEAGTLRRLRRRFQLVDHFSEESAEDIAAIAESGKRYLYSITPVDFAGNSGRPLSLVATRYPSDPPQVPTDAECIVQYVIGSTTLDPVTDPTSPILVPPAGLTVEWTDPPAPQQGPAIPIATYQLVFRRDPTIPVGSYGVDSTTQRPPAKVLPTTNARPLPTDAKIVISPQGPSDARSASVPLSDLQNAGILPTGASPAWRPESWRIFFQTVSPSGVPSSLAPVQLMLRVEADTGAALDPNRREERRPAELEWLPRPIKFPLLPPEDEAATTGPAHVPMPSGDHRFQGTVANLVRSAHPAGIRCIRFRWNQGPSATDGYPLDLNAGYQLLELDADAHTTETFSSPELPAGVLRPIQDVQMIPADELVLTPGDTLAPSQWEAWYPSAVQRRRDPSSRAEGSEIPRSPWYSWRESVLDWPAWTGLTDGAGIRDAAYHPALQAVLDALAQSYRLELQASPASQAEDLAAFLKATSPAADPYGWSVLQRFGLSVALRLRNADTGAIVSGQDLLGAVNGALSAAPSDAARHLHVELLFQPGRAIALDDTAASADDLVALVQLSLRPAIRQTRRYWSLDLEGKPGDTVQLLIALTQGQSCSVIDQGDPASGQAELSADAGDLAVVRTVRFPIGGRTALLFRGTAQPTIGIPLPSGTSAPSFTGTRFDGFLHYEASPSPHVIVDAPLPGATDADRDALAALLGVTPALAQLALSLRLEPFAATDEESTSFSMDPAALAADFFSSAYGAPSWSSFRRYAEALSSTNPEIPDDQKIRVPTSPEEIAAIVPDFASWSQRFFDHSGDVDAASGLGIAPAGPWVSSSYPRAGSPAHAAPDESGRLTYDHLLEDPWAHDYRYYVRPYGRYDLLWQSLRQSTVLFPDTPTTKLADSIPDPNAGGLDVVLERTRPVAKPLVLSSTRLDPPSTPASPAAPGPTWEVVIAEHPEQTLAEHNQTLARQLGFRQIAHTLLRTFAHPTWVDQLGAAATPPQTIELEPVQEIYPGLPGAYPSAPEHLDLSAPLADADARTLDLPFRSGPFQQGAIALHWEALPFYYEHHLLLVAQSASTVSPVNEIVQRDFEYRTPVPAATLESVRSSWTPPPPYASDGAAPLDVRARMVHLSLNQLWDSLPDSARQQWPSEAPDAVHRKPAWFPDLGVVYQLVETFQGNAEVQAEVYFDEVTGCFAVRQLGSRFLATTGTLSAPQTFAGLFSQAVTVQQVTEEKLSRTYGDADRAAIPEPTRSKVRFDGDRLSFVGVLTAEDLLNLLAVLDPADQPAIRSIYDGWDATATVSAAPTAIPPGLADALQFEEPTDTRLVWADAMSTAQRDTLLALPGDPEFKAAALRLTDIAATATAGDVSVAVAPLGPEHVPVTLQARLTLGTDGATPRSYTSLSWSGNLSDADASALFGWAQIRAASDASVALVGAADEAGFTQPVPMRPLPEELPAALQGRLLLGDTTLGWKGPAPTDAERAALGTLTGDSAFVDALARLVAQIDSARTVPLGPVVQRPTQASLPASLSAQLQIDPTALSWSGAAPTAEQRSALLSLQGDRAFLAAAQALLAVLDAGTGTSVPMDPFVPRPAQGDLPAILQARLLIGASTLEWTSPAPSDAERAALAALVADDALLDALVALVAAIDADQQVTMDPAPSRPTEADLPDWLGGQLVITRHEVRWSGRIANDDWRAVLLALPGDAPFVAAIQALVAAVDAQVLTVPFTVQVRPAAGELDTLSDQLLVGRAVLRYHGLMARAEVPAIQALFTRGADLKAVVRLYQATQASGMRGRELRIRTRRGTAPPSALLPFSILAI